MAKDEKYRGKDRTAIHGSGGVSSSGEITLEDGTIMKYTVIVAFKCMFCQKIVKVALMDNGRQGVLHDEPTCDAFDNNATEDFLSKTRMLMEADKQRLDLEAKRKREKAVN